MGNIKQFISMKNCAKDKNQKEKNKQKWILKVASAIHRNISNVEIFFCKSIRGKKRDSNWENVPSSSSLSSLTLKASDTLLPPFSSHRRITKILEI